MTSIFQKICRIPMLVVLIAAAGSGCQGGETVEGSSSQKLVNPGGLQHQDVLYMHALVTKQGASSIRLDLSDDTQNRFVRARLAAAGKTVQNAPELFASLDRIRARHTAQKADGLVEPAINTPLEHLIGDVKRVPNTNTFEALAFSTIEGGGDYSFVDVVVWNDSFSQQLSDYGWGEEYADGRKLRARATGLIPFGYDGRYQVDSVNLLAVDGVEETFYISAPAVLAPGGQVYHPRDFNSDNVVTICLDRDYGDCDYPMIGFVQVQIPLQGAITFPFPVAEIRNSPDNYVKLVEEGGGPRNMAFGAFRNRLQIDPGNPKQVLWNVPQSEGVFAGLLFQRYDDVDMFISIDVMLDRPGPGPHVQSTVKLSTLPDQTSPGMPRLPKIQIVYSCLAEGTQIRLADGTTARIEDISKAQRVLAMGSGMALEVVDVSVGIERQPMVRIQDDAGRNLLLTASHPVITPDRGVMWAEELTVGSKVITESGVATLTRVEREMYDGKVYNLKLDASELTSNPFGKGSTLYANGFLVGDLAMQSSYEFKHSEDLSANVLSRLPAAWHIDYQNSVSLNSATK